MGEASTPQDRPSASVLLHHPSAAGTAAYARTRGSWRATTARLGADVRTTWHRTGSAGLLVTTTRRLATAEDSAATTPSGSCSLIDEV